MVQLMPHASCLMPHASCLMTDPSTKTGVRPAWFLLFAVLFLGPALVGPGLIGPGLVSARFLDEAQTIRFNGRVYNRTAMAVEKAAKNTRLQTPYNSFNMLQNRTFLQLELRHDLLDLIEGNYQGRLSFLAPLLQPLQWLQLEDMSYFMTYRGEYDGVWDYGPDVYSERFPLLSNCAPASKQKRTSPRQFANCSRLNPRRTLRKRHRLFEAYVDLSWEALFLRIGRQNLSWGETDAFRLLDQINPLDASFGGFLVSLDDRRVPLDMIRAVYSFEDIGPFSEFNIEGYGAFDKNISSPVPAGSPWSAPNPLGLSSVVKKPAQNFKDTRGGFRITARAGDLTLSAAHYYTFLDTPEVRIVTPRRNPPINLAEFDQAVNDGQTSQYILDHSVGSTSSTRSSVVRFPKNSSSRLKPASGKRASKGFSPAIPWWMSGYPSVTALSTRSTVRKWHSRLPARWLSRPPSRRQTRSS